MAGSGTPAIALLVTHGITHRLHPYDLPADTPNYGAMVASVLGVEPSRVFKTLITDVDGVLTVAVVPVTGEVDLKALAAATGGKRGAMADRAVAERATGYVRGGISPLGHRKRLRTVIDASATSFPTVFVSAGRRGLQMELNGEDLARLADATLARIAG